MVSAAIISHTSLPLRYNSFNHLWTNLHASAGAGIIINYLLAKSYDFVFFIYKYIIIYFSRTFQVFLKYFLTRERVFVQDTKVDGDTLWNTQNHFLSRRTHQLTRGQTTLTLLLAPRAVEVRTRLRSLVYNWYWFILCSQKNTLQKPTTHSYDGPVAQWALARKRN